MFDVPKGVMLGSWLSWIKNINGKMVGPLFERVNGGIIRESLHYGWSRGIVNMPIHKGLNFPMSRK